MNVLKYIGGRQSLFTNPQNLFQFSFFISESTLFYIFRVKRATFERALEFFGAVAFCLVVFLATVELKRLNAKVTLEGSSLRMCSQEGI